MSKLEEKVSLYLDEFKNTLKIKVDESLLTKVAKGLGPAIYNPDASGTRLMKLIIKKKQLFN